MEQESDGHGKNGCHGGDLRHRIAYGPEEGFGYGDQDCSFCSGFCALALLFKLARLLLLE
jgi:hypothetical protein